LWGNGRDRKRQIRETPKGPKKVLSSNDKNDVREDRYLGLQFVKRGVKEEIKGVRIGAVQTPNL